MRIEYRENNNNNNNNNSNRSNNNNIAKRGGREPYKHQIYYEIVA